MTSLKDLCRFGRINSNVVLCCISQSCMNGTIHGAKWRHPGCHGLDLFTVSVRISASRTVSHGRLVGRAVAMWLMDAGDPADTPFTGSMFNMKSGASYFGIQNSARNQNILHSEHVEVKTKDKQKKNLISSWCMSTIYIAVNIQGPLNFKIRFD